MLRIFFVIQILYTLLLLPAYGERPIPPMLVDTVFHYEQTIGYQQAPAIAFDGTNYCIVWQDARLDPEGDITFIRVDPSGNIIDSAARVLLAIPGRQANPCIAYDGVNFCIVWEHGNGTLIDLHSCRLSPNGTVIDTVPFVVSSSPGRQELPQICFGAAVFCVVWQDNRADHCIYATCITPEGVVQDTNGIHLSPSQYGQYYPDVDFDGQNFFIVWDQGRSDIHGARLTESGSIIDTFALIQEVHPQYYPVIAFNGVHHLLVWEDERSGIATDIYGTMVDTAGAVLDSSGFIISDAIGHQNTPDIICADSDFFVVWQDDRNTAYDIYGARVRNDGTVLDTNGINISNFRYYQTLPSIVYGDSLSLVVWQDHRSGYGDDIYGSIVTNEGVVIDTMGILLSRYCNAQQQSSITYDGSQYFVTWQDNRDSVFYDIYGVHVDYMGVMTDPVSIPICSARFHQRNPTSAFDGTNHLTIWEDSRNVVNMFDLYGARVDRDGNVLDTMGIEILTGYGDQLEPAIAFGIDQYMAVWHDNRSGPANQSIYGARISTNGVVIDTGGKEIASGSWHETNPGIAFDGMNYFVAWEDHRDEIHIYGTRIDQNATILDTGGIPIATESYSRTPCVAYGNGLYFVVWIDARAMGGIYGARIDTSGTVLDTLGILIDEGTYNFGHPNVAYNGNNFIVVWFDQHQLNGSRDIYGKVIDTNGSILDSFCVFDDYMDQFSPCIAHGAGDQILLTFTGYLDTHNGQVVQADRIWSIVYPFVGIAEKDEAVHTNPVIYAFPNPFTYQVHLTCTTTYNMNMELEIYDITGRAIQRISLPSACGLMPAAIWSGIDQKGRTCPPGVYFLCMRSGDQIITKKVVKLN